MKMSSFFLQTEKLDDREEPVKSIGNDLPGSGLLCIKLQLMGRLQL